MPLVKLLVKGYYITTKWLKLTRNSTALIYLGASDKAIQLSFFRSKWGFSKIGQTNFVAFLVPETLHHIVFIKFLLFANNCWNKQNQFTFPEWPFLYFLYFSGVCKYFAIKNVSWTRYKDIYLQKKLSLTIRDFIKILAAIIRYSWITLWIT